ncbi:perlucin-like protein [Mytilus galloprovincialis]|uniref:perlucin-like protein n=1 Tax=Mytilus galloprovincialis TaxID=29158 RepID=UPI003F7B4A22
MHVDMLSFDIRNFLSITVFLPLYVDASCRSGWVEYGTSCYYFSTDSLNWRDASNDCRAHSAELVIIDSKEENAFIAGGVNNHTGSFWLDGSDEFTEGTWEWASNGEPFGFTSWLPHEPSNNRHDEDCLMTQKGYNGKWNDYGCSHRIKFICERNFDNPIIG